MDETWVLYESEPRQFLAWLDDLATLARAEQRHNRHRPQQPIASSAELNLFELPLPVRSQATHAGAIYARPPSAAEPFGRVLVLALIEAVETGVVRVEIASDPQFPLQGDEILWFLKQRFPRMARGAGGRRTGLLILMNQRAQSNHTGAPVLACNVWLEEQLAHLPNWGDARARRRLFRPWLERYRALRGSEPADPSRSYRAALQGCLHRLRRRARKSRG